MGTRRVWIGRTVALVIAGLSLYVLAPAVGEVVSAWPDLADINPVLVLLMIVAEALSFVSFWWLLTICLRTSEWFPVATSQLASNAVSRVVPGGAATATAVQFQMLREANLTGPTVATGLTVSGLLTTGVLLALPLLAAPSIFFGPSPDSSLVIGTVLAFAILVVAAVATTALLGFDRPLRLAGQAVDRFLELIHRPRIDQPPLADELIEARNLIRSHLRSQWPRALLAGFGKWALDFVVLLLAIVAVSDVDLSLTLLLAYVAAGVLGMVPLTPGGLGFVEAGLTGTLTLAGVPAGEAVVVTLLYRLVSYWLPLPAGGVAWVLHRRRFPSRLPSAG